MANKAINIKQSEREVGQLVGELRGRGNKRMSFGNWHFELFRFGFDFVRLPVCLPRPLSDKCIDAFAFSIIIFLGFPSPPPPCYFFVYFFLAFSLCKSMRKVFNCSGVTFWLLWYVFLAHFPQPQFMTKVFRRTHTHTPSDRQTDKSRANFRFDFLCVRGSVWFFKFCIPLAACSSSSPFVPLFWELSLTWQKNESLMRLPNTIFANSFHYY